MNGVLPAPGLYIHFPWCVSKCPYCDFNSHALKGALPERQYIDTLLADAAAQSPLVAGREITSVFLGGGTPSLFRPDSLAHLLSELRQQLRIAVDAEVTLEANPATVERGRFAEYRDAGINRVSLGAQSFDDETLRRLGRIHQRADVLRAAEELHAASLDNFNLDLMYALPDQDVRGALEDVRQALALRPAHLSHYQLTLEPGTVFAADPPPLPDDDAAWRMQQDCQALLAAQGFAQYEVSAYATRDRQCRHNLNYWRFGDYLGIGAGAHGKLTHTSPGGLSIRRSTHLREPRRYSTTASAGPAWREVPGADLAFEFLLNRLRLNEAFALREFEQRAGQPSARLRADLEKLAQEGLMESFADRWRPTARGYQHLNSLLQRFLPAAKPGENSSVAAGS
jgi:oxygen-independent coproporphyrinogen-3 oxidase